MPNSRYFLLPMNKHVHGLKTLFLKLIMMSVVTAGAVDAQQAPPELGQETKGQPAVAEVAEQTESAIKNSTESEESEESNETSGIDGLLGEAEIVESKRENGQVYRIELEHSSGAKQYIEETDSDGKLESTSNDIEETPNLPKWKLGSW